MVLAGMQWVCITQHTRGGRPVTAQFCHNSTLASQPEVPEQALEAVLSSVLLTGSSRLSTILITDCYFRVYLCFFLSASVWKVMCVLHMAYVHIKCGVNVLWLTQLRRKKEMRKWCFTYTLGRCTFDRDIWFWTGCQSRCHSCGIVCGYICSWTRCKEASYGCSHTKNFIAVEKKYRYCEKECPWFQKGHVLI